MRKNKKDRKGVKFLYSTFTVTGLNLDRLLNKLKKENIYLYNVKKKEKKLIITLSADNEEKFFAITKELCYTNINISRKKGKLFPFWYLLKNIGLIIGCLMFCISAILFDNTLLQIDYTGSGAVYKYQIESQLLSMGIKKYTPFTFDLKELSNTLLQNNSFLLFVNCYKEGSRLIVNTELLKEPKQVLEKKEKLVSDLNGEILEITVYRGTARVRIGDKISVGDTVIEGYSSVNGQSVFTGAIGKAVIKTEKVFTYLSQKDDEAEYLEILSRESLDKNVLSCSTETSKEENGFLYTVKVVYITVLST